MIDLARVVGFDWDDGNVRKNVDKHAVTQAEAEQVFSSARILLTDDVGHSAAEARYQGLGETLDGRRLHVSFTLRQSGTLIRIISARDMNRKERARYEAEA
jgi:uncharacterized DUF497 family protein